ncbi:MAG TPA: ABC transporter permease [Ktedonobacterales bacterium]
MSYILDPTNWDITDPESIPNLLFAHLSITGISLLIGLILAFPIALLVMRYQRLYLPVITGAGIIYTIPSLALLALLVPFTGLNAPTIIIPLVLYAQIVLIRNIVAAIRAVDPQLVEVGRAMGMNQTQLLLRVVLPLALPVIVAGIRVATVTTIGIATLAPLIGVADLGTIIFRGRDFASVPLEAGGVILVCVLAVGADLLLLALQTALSGGFHFPFKLRLPAFRRA